MEPWFYPLGDAAVRLTIWLALLGYLAGPLGAWIRRSDLIFQAWSRRIYTAGFVFFVLHVVAAFHVVHGWSHGRALVETARQTAELTGVESGAGLWANYLFILLWLLDVAAWWSLGLGGYRRRAWWIAAGLHGYFLFMALNATVVFEQGPIRWIGLAVTLGLVTLAWRKKIWRLRQPSAEPPR